MNRLLWLTGKILLGVVLAAPFAVVHATDWPYDEKGDAPADVQRALAAATADHRDVLLVFGANWCGDCRALDKAMHGSSQQLMRASSTW